jgi:hypothetical protein
MHQAITGPKMSLLQTAIDAQLASACFTENITADFADLYFVALASATA